MGLAASQARLLTITARKSDCEAQSMRYSHQKLALSRDLTDISNEYQNSLDLTKLVYDFYGTGDETNPLSYSLMMTPSSLNGYLPILLTDSSGKVVLSSQYAAAARAAGIPQEGLGSLPSSDVRNKFLQGLADAGVITQSAAETYMGIQYSQSIGLGTTDLVTTTVEEMTLQELLDYYTSGEFDAISYTYDSTSMESVLTSGNNRVEDVQLRNGESSNEGLSDGTSITLADILNSDYNYQILIEANYWQSDDRGSSLNSIADNIANLDIWDWLFDEFEALLNISSDPNISAAFEYAKSMTEELLSGSDNYAYTYSGKTKENKDDDNWSGVLDAMYGVTAAREEGGFHWLLGKEGGYDTSDYIGITKYYNTKNGKRNRSDGISISVTNIAYAFLTYFAQAMEGLSTSNYSVDNTTGNRTVENSNLISLDDQSFLFSVVVDTGVNTDQALISGFYDAIFNQICTRGWTENNQVQDNDYMQEMLKTGKFFLTTCADDGYYYQGNYSTNTYVREVSDEEAIAKAEAKYNTEKQKLNSKEEILDLKMKNLDTEISSLTTEYDTVKSLISKNIEKSFKRYDA